MDSISSGELKQYKYFEGLSGAALQELSRKLEFLVLPAGTLIIEQGTPPDAFYFLKRGKVEVTKVTRLGQTARISVLSSGQGFGEVALLTCSHRASSVRAKTNVILGKLSKKDFEDIIMVESAFTSMLVKKIQDYSLYNRLKTYQPFALLEPEKMLALTDRLIEKSFRPGESIIIQGEKGDFYYIIKSGTVAILVKQKETPEPWQVAVLRDGESFGEEALIRDYRRNATAQALTGTTVLALARADFDRILKSSFLEYAFSEEILENLKKNKESYVFLDARIPPEYEEEHIAGAVNIPLEVLRQKYRELDPKKEYLAYCTNESRGMAAAFLLRSQGFNAKNIRGGLSGWTGPVSTGSDGIHLPGTGG
jgi:CRP-like cAMP-binding protein